MGFLKKEDKRGDEILHEQIIFIVLTLIFIAVMFIFVFRSGSGAAFYEQIYAKNIALLIDAADDNTEIYLDIAKGVDIAKKNDYSGPYVVVAGNIVNVSLAHSQYAYSYSFFNDADVSVEYLEKEKKVKLVLKSKDLTGREE